MQKKQWLGEITLGTTCPTLTDGINGLFEQIMQEEKTDNIEVHQVVPVGANSFFVIYNYYV
ncbi:hypothetical protein [Lysinibacillus sp. RS5]|uniref:hypothetical protein n=1 Tax=unclassified Lysinibacillus TaxID=2636778 RepID=UPI0035BE2C6A